MNKRHNFSNFRKAAHFGNQKNKRPAVTRRGGNGENLEQSQKATLSDVPSRCCSPGTLYPELLNKSELIQRLQQRLVSRPDLGKMKKEELVDMCSKVCSPLPQRDIREDTRRGKIIIAERKAAKRTKATTELFDDISPTKRFKSDKETISSGPDRKTAKNNVHPRVQWP